jgi:hypothetical protein
MAVREGARAVRGATSAINRHSAHAVLMSEGRAEAMAPLVYLL